jgi:hypothetical protein
MERMNAEKLKELNELKWDLDNAKEYYGLASRQDSLRGKITCLLGNAPKLVTDDTFERCWAMMSFDAHAAIAELSQKFDKA